MRVSCTGGRDANEPIPPSSASHAYEDKEAGIVRSHCQTAFQHKDVIRAVGPSFGLDKLEALVGKQRQALDELGMVSLMAVLALGTLLARVRF